MKRSTIPLLAALAAVSLFSGCAMTGVADSHRLAMMADAKGKVTVTGSRIPRQGSADPVQTMNRRTFSEEMNNHQMPHRQAD